MNRTITFQSFDAIYRSNRKSSIKYWFIGTIGLLVLIMFLPWTQNIKANGDITTLRQDHRPQEINTPIAGKISSWHVKEGDYVHKGDTIVKITEIKAEYLDPNLVSRTQQQVTAKKGAIGYYEGKINTTDAQIEALRTAKKLKIEQLNNKASQLRSKLEGEQAEFTAILNEYTLAKDQYERQQKMFAEGLVSQTQLQQRNVSFQNALAKKIVIENKIMQSQQEITNNKLEQNSVEQDYSEKINKAEGDKFQSLSQIASGQSDVAKLENQVAN
jgi:multidrug efflux pump subunit AcrA (membrane-fusion protein)